MNGSAPEAAAVVINVKTGAIEAMYGNPTYDPTLLASPNIATEKYAYAATAIRTVPLSPLVSRTFQRGFLPGSTFKTVTSAAVYDHQPALAKVDYPGRPRCIAALPQSDKPLCNYGHNGPNGPEKCGGVLTETLPASCDTAFAQLGMALGGVSLTQEAEAFGFNQVPPIDLPGANASTFPAGSRVQPQQAVAGVLRVRPAGRRRHRAADGPGGRRHRQPGGDHDAPRDARHPRHRRQPAGPTYQPKPWLTATNPLTAAAVTSLMQAVVTNGTATQVGFPAPWNVAAKTGTAETGPNATADQRLDDRLRPGQQPQGGGGGRGAQPAGQRHRRRDLGTPDEDHPRRRPGGDPVSDGDAQGGTVQDQQFRTPEPSDSRHRL